MEQYEVSNELLTIKVKSKGAELCSLKRNDTGKEYLWHGNPEFWGRTSPVLFPFVGSCKNKEYRYDGRVYPVSQHGFARDMEFKLVSLKESSIWFALSYNEETLEKYPFRFLLEIGYRLIGESVEVLWKVTNMDTQTMYFSIGGHPAFMCPLEGEGIQTEYAIEYKTRYKHKFSQKAVEDGKEESENRHDSCHVSINGEVYPQKLEVTVVNEQGLVSSEKDIYTLTDGKMPVTAHLFDKDALVIEHEQVQQVSLLNPFGKKYLSVKFDTPLVGVWSPPKKNAPFICIEPWFGRCDRADFEGSLEDREWGNALKPGREFETSYSITVY